MSLQAYSPEAEYRHCIRREKEERAAARGAPIAAIEAHIVMAERYADRAWSLSERFDLPYAPSGLWQTVPAGQSADA